MSIVTMRKVTLVGPAYEREATLAALQELGVLHVLPLAADPPKKETGAKPYPKEAAEALRYLLDSPLQRSPVTESTDFDLAAVVREALELRARQRDLDDHADEVRERIAEVEPWGDFHLPPREELAGQRLWFYVVPLYAFRSWDGGGLVWELVHRDHREAYVVIVSESEPPASQAPGPRSHVGVVPLSELRLDLERTVSAIEEVRAARWSLTRYIGLMVQRFNQAEDSEALRQAERSALEAEELFAVQGWAPAREIDGLLALARERGLAITSEDPAPDESPPILLENSPYASPGQDLVAFYQLPGYRDWDPSPVVFYSFAVFFAMILGDAGYGALLVVATAVLWKRLSASASSRRTRRLLATIAIFSLVYGVLLGSYMGASPPAGSLLAKVKILEINDYSSMMGLTVAIGVLHLVFANLVAAWNQRGSWTFLSRVGWAFAITGGLAAFLGRTGIAYPALAVGGGLVLLFTSARPLRGPLDVVKRFVDGLLGLTNVSKAFGDVLSYLRLFALGLASASLAFTFNKLAADVRRSELGAGLVIALLILVLGHGINFVLGIIGGVIHGLRLNLIEMYGWSVFDEGKKFEPLRSRAIDK